jgi:hypothetical protein
MLYYFAQPKAPEITKRVYGGMSAQVCWDEVIELRRSNNRFVAQHDRVPNWPCMSNAGASTNTPTVAFQTAKQQIDLFLGHIQISERGHDEQNLRWSQLSN